MLCFFSLANFTPLLLLRVCRDVVLRPNVLGLLSILLIAGLPFAAFDSATSLQLVELGIPKEKVEASSRWLVGFVWDLVCHA